MTQKIIDWPLFTIRATQPWKNNQVLNWICLLKGA